MASKFEDDLADILTDFKNERLNYSDAIIKIEAAIVHNLGLTLMGSERYRKVNRRKDDHPKG